jgi:hypothetical protein
MTTNFYSSSSDPAHRPGFLAEGGEMGELTRNFDWSKTSIGSRTNGLKAFRLP